ncbi:MAG: family 1 glycosylhydrolase, partial [Actinomycetota bacterium]
STWRERERAGHAPASGDGNGFATRYAEDFALYAAHGLTHHRLSLEWARLEPRRGAHAGEAVEHYRAVLQSGRDAGLTMWVCLHQVSLPGWFADDEGGFLDDGARSGIWQRHVAWCAETFGDLVDGWKPLTFEPGGDPTLLRSKHLAHRDAWRELRGGGVPVATLHRLSPVHRLGGSDRSGEVTRVAEQAIWTAPIRAMRDGILAVPGLAEEEVPDLQGSADLFGFSYYSAMGIGEDGSVVPYPPDARVGPLGYAPWSEGLGVVLHRLDEELPDTPLLIAEHGVGTDDDRWRVDTLRESLGQVDEAVGDGVDVRGFFHWTGVDGYEFSSGFGVPFGLFNRDREAKPSAELLASYARP